MNYTIEVIQNNIFAVIIPDRYDRCMTFLKVAEYYESPEFKGKHFTFWEFMRWYTEKNGTFSYVKDWEGANVPLKVFRKFINHGRWIETPYDYYLCDIWDRIDRHGLKNGYVIFTDSTEGETFDHEMCHAKFYLDKNYKKLASILVDKLPSHVYNPIKDSLLDMGYCEDVIMDEIQAYMTTNYWDLNTEGIEDLAKKFEETLGQYIKK